MQARGFGHAPLQRVTPAPSLNPSFLSLHPLVLAAFASSHGARIDTDASHLFFFFSFVRYTFRGALIPGSFHLLLFCSPANSFILPVRSRGAFLQPSLINVDRFGHDSRTSCPIDFSCPTRPPSRNSSYFDDSRKVESYLPLPMVAAVSDL